MSLLTSVAAAAGLIVFVLLLFRPSLGITGLVLFYPFWVFAPRLPVPGMNVETALMIIAMAMTLMRFGGRIPPLRYSLPVLSFVLVIIAAATISALSIPNDQIGMTSWQIMRNAKYHTFTVLMFFLGYWWFPEWRDRRRLLEAMSIGIGIASASVILDTLHPFTVSALDGRPTGFFENSNGSATTLAAFMFVGLYLLRCPDLSRARRWVHGLVYATALVAVVLTLSRAAWAATLAGHAIWLFYVNRRALLMGAVATVLAATVAFPLLPMIMQQRLETTTRAGGGSVVIKGFGRLDNSTAFRVLAYRVGIDMFMESPVWGHGLDSFYLLTPHYGAKYGILKHKDSHSIVLRFMAETGLIGLGVLLWVVLAAVRVGQGLWRWSDQDPDLGVLLLTVGGSIGLGSIAQGAFLQTPAQSAYFWILLGIAGQFFYLGDEVPELEEAEIQEAESQTAIQQLPPGIFLPAS